MRRLHHPGRFSALATAIGLLGTDTTTRTIADLLAVARGLEHEGITTYCYTGGYAVPPVTLTGSARGDLVHVDRIIGIGETAIADHRSSQPSFGEIARLAADAHVSGLMTGKAGLLHLHLGGLGSDLHTEVRRRVVKRGKALQQSAGLVHAALQPGDLVETGHDRLEPDRLGLQQLEIVEDHLGNRAQMRADDLFDPLGDHFHPAQGGLNIVNDPSDELVRRHAATVVKRTRSPCGRGRIGIINPPGWLKRGLPNRNVAALAFREPAGKRRPP